ncbi:uncharacterized protein LOC142317852 [Lycorma delicatula]|uniref:uncharacterized protein LOC142317852 n=1 Tax=Lycorma delicatula TaxID=130591 RepID=UPI003F50E3C6
MANTKFFNDKSICNDDYVTNIKKLDALKDNKNMSEQSVVIKSTFNKFYEVKNSNNSENDVSTEDVCKIIKDGLFMNGSSTVRNMATSLGVISEDSLLQILEHSVQVCDLSESGLSYHLLIQCGSDSCTDQGHQLTPHPSIPQPLPQQPSQPPTSSSIHPLCPIVPGLTKLRYIVPCYEEEKKIPEEDEYDDTEEENKMEALRMAQECANIQAMIKSLEECMNARRPRPPEVQNVCAACINETEKPPESPSLDVAQCCGNMPQCCHQTKTSTCSREKRKVESQTSKAVPDFCDIATTENYADNLRNGLINGLSNSCGCKSESVTQDCGCTSKHNEDLVQDCGCAQPQKKVKEDCGCAQPQKKVKEDCGCAQPQKKVEDCGCAQPQKKVEECGCAQPQKKVKEDCGCAQPQKKVKEDCGCAQPQKKVKEDCGCAQPQKKVKEDCGCAQPQKKVKEDCGCAQPQKKVKEDCGCAQPQKSVKEDCGCAQPQQSVKEDCGCAHSLQSVQEDCGCAQPEQNVQEDCGCAQPEQIVEDCGCNEQEVVPLDCGCAPEPEEDDDCGCGLDIVVIPSCCEPPRHNEPVNVSTNAPQHGMTFPNVGMPLNAASPNPVFNGMPLPPSATSKWLNPLNGMQPVGAAYNGMPPLPAPQNASCNRMPSQSNNCSMSCCSRYNSSNSGNSNMNVGLPPPQNSRCFDMTTNLNVFPVSNCCSNVNSINQGFPGSVRQSKTNRYN